MTGTDRIVVAQCTNQKRDERAPARDLYDESDYFRKQRRYAEVRGDAWYIQSAEYGLVEPDHTLTPYDTRPKDLDDDDAWGEHVADQLVRQEGTDIVVEILGGKTYADPLTPALERRGIEVHEPLRGQRIGTRKRSLIDRADKAQEVEA
jgi:hypothetical protein